MLIQLIYLGDEKPIDFAGKHVNHGHSKYGWKESKFFNYHAKKSKNIRWNFD